MDCPPKKWPLLRGGRCGKVPVSGGSTVYIIQPLSLREGLSMFITMLQICLGIILSSHHYA